METVEEEMGKRLQGQSSRIGFPEAIFNIKEGYSVVKFSYTKNGTLEMGFRPVEYAGYVGLRTNEYTLPLFATMTWEFGRRIHLKQSDRTRIMESAIRLRTSASQACGSTLLSLAVPMRVYIAAARTPPRSEPQNSHDFRPKAIPLSALSAALCRHRHNAAHADNRIMPRSGRNLLIQLIHGLGLAA